MNFNTNYTKYVIIEAYWKDRKNEIKYGHVIGFSKILLENLLLRKGYKIIEMGYTIKNEYCGIGKHGKVNFKIVSKVCTTDVCSMWDRVKVKGGKMFGEKMKSNISYVYYKYRKIPVIR